ncbi:MAG: hypothetical protein QNJ54_15260 [Prochloraceae cyanobacterium]|nr:hypothetical protein [Prochloraceae cyanobacterium]
MLQPQAGAPKYKYLISLDSGDRPTGPKRNLGVLHFDVRKGNFNSSPFYFVELTSF